MDRSFDLVALLKQRPTTKSHKIRPTQFVSVAEGVQKRLETNIKNRKSCRMSVFDKIRNISKCETPKAPVLSDVQQKALYEKQQLEKWKEEKEKRKKEAAAQKKKPFVAGVSHRKSFGPPPPAKPMPSTSGRVTRSQARQKIELKQSNTQTQSFAPHNASFRPPQFLNSKVPTLAPVNKRKTNKPIPSITFEPVLQKTLQKVETRTTRARPVANKPITTDSKIRKPNEKAKAKVTNPSLKPPPLKQHMFQSSESSSDMEQIKTKPSQQKSIHKVQESSIKHVLQSSSSSDMAQEKTKLRTKPSQRKTKPVQASPMKQHVFESSSSSDIEVKKNPRNKSSQRKSIHMVQESPMEQVFHSSSSSDMGEKITNPKNNQSQRKSISKIQETESILQDSDCILQDSASTSSQNESLSTPRNKVPNSESSSEEKLRSPKSIQVHLTPEQIREEAKNISPCVTMSRGKDNARKEMKKKLEEELLDEDISKMDSINHFRRQLDSEIARITAMCDTWDVIFAQTVLPEPIQELVLTARGQARLLMSQKLQQFAALVERCARPEPRAALVTPADLHGFWDMVFMQIENVDMRFKKLEELRLANWIEEQKPLAKKVIAKPVVKKAVAKPNAGPSRLREMIAAARKAKKEQEFQSETSKSEKSASSPEKSAGSPAEVKTFEAGFFSVSSPLKRGSPAPSTPANKSSLLKSVLSSEARKSVSKNSTSFAMLRASLMSKNVDIEGVSPRLQTPTITPVNLYATPARSILKQKNPVSSKKTDKLKTVLFHESDTEVPSSPVSYASCDKSPEQSVIGVAVLAVEEKENEPTPRRRSRFSRQNAEEWSSPVMTRSRRKSAQTPLVEPHVNVEATKRSTRQAKETQEADTDEVHEAKEERYRCLDKY